MGNVRVQFLGSGDAIGSGGRFQTCIYVQASTTRFLIDCGASSLIAMKQAGIDPSVIDACLVSHLHGDHFGGLPFLILDGQFSRRTLPLVVGGPPGLEERTHQAKEALFPGSSLIPQKFAVEFVELLDRQATTIRTLEVTPYRVDHASGAPAYALRVRCARKAIAYSGDTAWTEALVNAADGTDPFICEAYCFEKQVKFHLDYRTLMSHRPELRCERLILTHMSADMLARLDEIDVECAEDGLCIDL